ncbi:MAG: hypothetical protein JXR76_20260 [Deltaproteobacteria bacterium]|nr:hypothetical protein [Deltaproteobacteria bacterium]
MKYVSIIFISCFMLFGCAKEIGDSCSRDMNCSVDGDRTCDGTQPGGYCLIITCSPDECPSEAVCAEFTTPSPNFEADSDSSESQGLYARMAPNRTRTYCLRKCKKDKDCRDRYHCAMGAELEDEVTGLNGLIIDSTWQGLGVCVPGKPLPEK